MTDRRVLIQENIPATQMIRDAEKTILKSNLLTLKNREKFLPLNSQIKKKIYNRD